MRRLRAAAVHPARRSAHPIGFWLGWPIVSEARIILERVASR